MPTPTPAPPQTIAASTQGLEQERASLLARLQRHQADSLALQTENGELRRRVGALADQRCAGSLLRLGLVFWLLRLLTSIFSLPCLAFYPILSLSLVTSPPRSSQSSMSAQDKQQFIEALQKV